MKTLLICHKDDELNRQALAAWLASFSDLAGIVELVERPARMRKRVQREIERIGSLRFLDVLAFRLFYKLRLSAGDRLWEQNLSRRLLARYGTVPESVPVLETISPNSPEAERFIRDAAPDITIARCKTLLAERIFTLPRIATLVMHPGVCPEYRNAHGCFWALANDDLNRVGMTLLKIDKGVDTGPVYGYFGCDYDEVGESHIVIQHRVVFDNLDAIRQKVEEIFKGTAKPLDTTGRKSAVWGQPWMTRYIEWKRRAGRKKRE
jgi:hypothetical protein